MTLDLTSCGKEKEQQGKDVAMEVDGAKELSHKTISKMMKVKTDRKKKRSTKRLGGKLSHSKW